MRQPTKHDTTSRHLRWLPHLASLPIAGLAIGAATTTLGCGASYQAMYEGEVRFEHCYRLDKESSVAIESRRACWQDWTRRYPNGQSRDRLVYALRRQRELTVQLNGGPAAQPTEPATQDTPQVANTQPPPPQPSPPLGPAVHTGTGQNMHALLPGASSPAANGPLSPPRATCMSACKTGWMGCTGWCQAGSKDERCRQGCDVAYRDCAGNCLK